jgi:manganese-dependent inorganic pyrophosphatase
MYLLQMVAALREDPDRASRIVGLIDHHAIAESYSTKGPTFLDVRPWGSMASIVAHSYIRDGRTLEVPYARILLCAILSDTLALRSPTTTQADRLIVSLLSVMGGVDEPQELAKRMFRAKTNWIVNLGPTEMVRGDQKDFKSVRSQSIIAATTAAAAVFPFIYSRSGISAIELA